MYIYIFQMKAGVVINVVCLVVLQLGINTWAYYFFDLGQYPDWARNILPTSRNDNITADIIFQNMSSVGV